MTTASRGPGRGRLSACRKGGRTVYIGDWVDAAGDRHREVLSDDRPTALRILNAKVRRRDLERAGMASELGLDLTYREVADAYLRDLAARGKRAHTIATYRRALERLERELPARTLRDVTKAKARAWLSRRAEGGSSNKTANTELGALRAALSLQVELEQLGIHPLLGMRDLPTANENMRRPPRALTEDEVARLLAASDAADRRLPGIPRGPLLRALLETGARWNELIQATWGDFDTERSTLTFRSGTTKTKRARTIPLSADMCSILEAHLAACRRVLGRDVTATGRIFLTSEGHAWPQNTGRFRLYLMPLLKVAGIPRKDDLGRVVHVHSLRHTFATRCARAGVPMQVAQKLLGHATARMTIETYAHVDDSDSKNAIDLLNRLSSRGRIPSVPRVGPVAVDPA